MRIPNADQAVIAKEKLCDYLLNKEHRRGGSKAILLLKMGYHPNDWRDLERDLREQHLTAEIDRESETDYGPRYEISAALTGPSGRLVNFRSIWQIDTGTDVPRLITMHPE